MHFLIFLVLTSLMVLTVGCSAKQIRTEQDLSHKLVGKKADEVYACSKYPHEHQEMPGYEIHHILEDSTIEGRAIVCEAKFKVISGKIRGMKVVRSLVNERTNPQGCIDFYKECFYSPQYSKSVGKGFIEGLIEGLKKVSAP